MKTLKLAPLLALGLSSIGIPAWAFNVTINPPPSLQLDGQNIMQGEFRLTSATGFSINIDGISIDSTALDVTNAVVNNAQIGSTDTHILLQNLSNDFQALNFSGFFDASNPDLPQANLNITIFGITNPSVNGTGDFTYGLPMTTSQPLQFQLTDLRATTSLDDNLNFFNTQAPTLTISNGRIIGNSNGIPVGATAFRGGGCSPTIQGHGGGTGTQPPVCIPDPVPEPLTILGTGIALGFGGYFKKKFSARPNRKKDKS